MKHSETRLDATVSKPFSEMDLAELVAVEGHCGQRIAELNNLFAEFRAISATRQRARAELRDRFAIDPKTGRRIRRKGRGELDLTG